MQRRQIGRTEPIALPQWPGGAKVAVAITFDVDAESGWRGAGEKYANRLTTLSDARFGVRRGLPRILELLGELAVPATFYVPGDTAARFSDDLAGLKDSAHEIGHHGHLHLVSHTASAAQQRNEIEDGLAALERHLGTRPRGYRSPGWELTPETFAVLVEHGFEYDSSCMGDDRPYVETHKELSILELPVHWSLDDAPYFAFIPGAMERLTSTPAEVLEIWLGELDSAGADGRLLTLTMHPEIVGRGYRMPLLRGFLEAARERGDVWFGTHGEIADHLGDAAAARSSAGEEFG